MKKTMLVGLIALFAAALADGGDTTRGESNAVQKRSLEKVRLTKDQREYLDKYCRYRWWGILTLRINGYSIPKNPSISAARPAAAQHFLDLPATATWDDIKKHKRVAEKLTVENQKKFGKIFCGKEDADWEDILNAVEALRKLREAGGVVMGAKRPGWSLFLLAKKTIL